MFEFVDEEVHFRRSFMSALSTTVHQPASSVVSRSNRYGLPLGDIELAPANYGLTMGDVGPEPVNYRLPLEDTQFAAPGPTDLAAISEVPVFLQLCVSRGFESVHWGEIKLRGTNDVLVKSDVSMFGKNPQSLDLRLPRDGMTS